MPEGITALTDLETVEVSLVKNGANRKRIAFRKGENMPKTKEEVLKAVLEVEAVSDKEVAQIEGLKDEGVDAVVLAARALAGFSDLIPESAHAAIAKALGLKLTAPEPKKDQVVELTPEAKELFAKAQEKADQAEKRVAEVSKALDDERNERRSKEFVAKAATFKIVGDANKTGELLKRVTDLDADLASHLETILKSASEIAEKSELFVAKGSSVVTEELDAYGKIKKVAEEIRKSEPKLTMPQAIKRAVETNPDLGRAYSDERNG